MAATSWSGSVTSATNGSADGSSATTASAPSSVVAPTSTWWSRPRTSATARPIPRDAPVTRAMGRPPARCATESAATYFTGFGAALPAWSMGVICRKSMLTCAGRVATKVITSATSSAVSDSTPW